MIRVQDFIKNEKLYFSDNFISDPTVSVIMPTYCRGDSGLLKRAIDSVLGQSYLSLELIIVDDGSVDSTQTIVKKYLADDTRILYIRNDKNSGLPALRVNQGLLHARGRYVAYQFDDDRWTKDGLLLLVQELEKQKSLAVVYGEWEVFDVQNSVRAVRSHEFDYASLISGNYIANNSVLHHKEILEQYGMYDCHLIMRRLCDWDLWLRWAKEIPFIYIDKVVSNVDSMVENSLGSTVAYDLSTSRIAFAQMRNDLLTPQHILDYDVYDLSFIDDFELKTKIYNRHILPWSLKHPELPLNGNIYHPDIFSKHRIICTKTAYDSTINIMVENYTNLCSSAYNLIFIPEDQLQYNDLLDGDILLLCRATTQASLDIIRRLKAENRNITAIYFIDDDLLNIYTISEDFSYISPNTTMYKTVEELLRLSNHIVAFSQPIADTVRNYNKSVTVLKTNVPSKYLCELDAYTEKKPFNIVFMGGSARKNEFLEIQEDLIRISEKYKNNVRFTFLGFIPTKMMSIETSDVEYKEFTSSYYQYMNSLSSSNYNLLLCPLHNNAFTQAKSPIKLLEACCCGAIGLYSDVPVYDCIEDGVHGYKIKEGDDWFEKIDCLIQKPVSEKKKVFNQALTLVRENFTSETGLLQFKLAVKSAQLVRQIENKTILYVCHSAYLAGAENHLFRHCLLSKHAGFSVAFALPSSAEGQDSELKAILNENNIDTIYLNYINYCEHEDIDVSDSIYLGQQMLSLLQGYNIALIHSCTLIPSMGYVARTLAVPYIASLYATESDSVCLDPDYIFAPDIIHSDSVIYANIWQDKLGRISRCIRSYTPESFFKRHCVSTKKVYRAVICGTLQERKGQLELIRAAGLLKDSINLELYIFGYNHFFPKYKKTCEEAAEKYNIKDKVFFKGFVSNVYKTIKDLNIDILICASTFESFPQVVLEAMALEIPIVSTPVAGIPELIINESTGFLAKGYTDKDISDAISNCIAAIENSSIVPILINAKKAVIRECSFENVSYQLFDFYLNGIFLCKKKYGEVPPKSSVEALKSIPIVRSRKIESDKLALSGSIRRFRRYNITCAINTISEIGILFSAKSCDYVGTIAVSIYAKGILLRKVKTPIDSINLENWTYFHFNPINNCGGKVLLIEITVEYAKGSPMLAVYEDNRNRTFIYKVLNKLKMPLKGMNTLYADLR